MASAVESLNRAKERAKEQAGDEELTPERPAWSVLLLLLIK